MTSKTTTYQNSTIHYRISGEGKTIVLIHGFAEDGNIWNEQVEVLEKQFRVVVPDIPGSGISGLIASASIEIYAEVIKFILDEVFQSSTQDSEKTVVMIGHSMGGYITLAFAEKYPEYLQSFGLFHSSAFADNEEKKLSRAKAIDFIKEHGAYPFLKTTIPGLFTPAYAEQHPEKIEELLASGKSFSAEALIQYYQAMIERPDRTGVLTGFSKPILFIIGEHDQAIPLQSSLQQCYLPAKSHVHILNQSAHMGMWEEREKANEIILNFIA